MGIQIGRPQIVWLNSGNLLAAVRLQKNENQAKRTTLGSIHPDSGKIEELLTFPTGGDTSYP